ncbi:MAG: hypothetical protein KFH87_12165 [Bacteroidetes bacterium]|nr:hypothetical protein [Bacteroidota bacterium]
MIEKQLCEQLFAAAVQSDHADEVFIVLRATDEAALRFAANVRDPMHQTSALSLTVSVRKGNRYATVTGNEANEQEVRALVRRAADLTSVMPDIPDGLPFPSAVDIPTAPLFDQYAPERIPAWFADSVLPALDDAVNKHGLLYSGSVAAGTSVLSLATSNGLFLYQPSSLGHLHVRVFDTNGRSTAFGERFHKEYGALDFKHVIARISETCRAWRKPEEIPPRRITTVFEPRALADMLAPMMRQFSRQAIEQEQSFLRRLDGSSFLGSRMFDERVTLRSDPYDQRLPSMPFTGDGQIVRPEHWIDRGVIAQLITDRYDAALKNVKPVAAPTNLVMDVADPVRDLIAETEHGILVKGFSDLNIIDPGNCLLRGSTRDGVFLIEDGEITAPVRNLLLRETPVYLLKELLAIGVPEVTSTTGNYFPMLLPPIRVKDVMYTQLSGLV